MLTYLFYSDTLKVCGCIAAFILTLLLMMIFKGKMPSDQGRAFAVEGTLSKGKIRGVGLLFVIAFALSDFLFNDFSIERTIYLVVIIACMLTGFFDDASERPWNEYLKGTLDFVLAVIVAITFLYFNDNIISISLLDYQTFTIPKIVYAILIILLVWTSINVTNCTDGVDGLSATLSIITLASFYIVTNEMWGEEKFAYSVMLFIVVLVAYLWFNATPSTMLMGDAGSRAMGMIIALAALKSGCPLLYIPFALVMIFDGGLGLIKVSVIRFLKIKSFMEKIRCPLHDHARKVKEWSNTQVVFRFAIIQLAICSVIIMILKWR